MNERFTSARLVLKIMHRSARACAAGQNSFSPWMISAILSVPRGRNQTAAADCCRHSRSAHGPLRTYNEVVSTAMVVKQIASANFPSRWGNFRIYGFRGESGSDGDRRAEEAVALVMGDVHSAPPLVRIHSQCLTGDVFHSLRCDCRQQLEMALAMIAQAGAGILVYEQQEGRGIGLMAKLQAYELQDQGRDTIEANLELGYKADCREYELPAAILKLMGVESVRLITNNPEKVEALEAVGITVAERISA